MSVINQMLKDLEQRRGVSEHGRYVPDSKRASLSWFIWLPCSVLFGVGAGLFMWSYLQPKLPSPMPGSAVSTVEAKMPATVSGAPSAPRPVALPLQADVSAASSPALPALATESVPVETVVGMSDEIRDEKETDEEPLTSDDQLYVNQPKSSRFEENGLARNNSAFEESSSTSDTTIIDDSPVTEEQPADELQIEEVTLSPAEEASLQRRQAEQAMTKGDLPKARSSLSALLQATPLDHSAREKLAGLLFGAGEEAEARRVLEQGMALAPTYANYRLLLARMEMSVGQKSRALAHLRDCEPEVRSNLDFYATRAALAQELGDYPLAASSYQKLTVQQPAEGRWWLGLGIAYEKAGRPQAALDAYRRAELSAGLSVPSREFVRQRRIRLEGAS